MKDGELSISIPELFPIALMCDDISLAKITTKLRFDNAKCKFYSQSSQDEKNIYVKTTRGQRKFG